jgi:membrane-associated phospholipid phosphatase
VRAAVLLYPASVLFCIVVTGNHYWIDGVGGLIVLGAGFLIGNALFRWNQRRLDARPSAATT